MAYLIVASLLWAYSFGLIKTQFEPGEYQTVAFLRLLLSALVFLPWLMRTALPGRQRGQSMGLGAVQFGLMYACYFASFRWLPGYVVALLTIFTPLYVALLVDLLERRFRWRHLAGALVAIIGAGIVLVRGFSVAEVWPGVLLIQAANFCFAVGQVFYRRVSHALPDASMMAWMYVGAAAVTAPIALLSSDIGRISLDGSDWLAILYLGVLPSGVGFYLWNRGAARASAGALAVSNNLKIPLAILCSWLVFGEEVELGRVVIGLAVVILALFVAGIRDTGPKSAGIQATQTRQ